MERTDTIVGLFDSRKEIDVVGIYDRNTIWFILGYSESNDIFQRFEIIYRNTRDIEGISAIHTTVHRIDRHKAIGIYEIRSRNTPEI